GRADNPINFVCVDDVARVVERAVMDERTRETTLQIGGPENLTLDQLAALVQAKAGRTGAPRHIPRPAMWLIANTLGRARPEVGRQVRAALAMDTSDLTFDATAIHRLYPDLPSTAPATCLAGSPVVGRS